MNPSNRNIKDRLYYFFVERNSLICNEYSAYVNARLEEHKSQRWRHWLVLLRLNWHYRVRRASAPLLVKRPGPAGQPSAPYLAGPESAKGKRQDPYHFAAGLMKYDVISFDIFDTLILRSLNNPADLFAFIGEILGIYNFTNLRQKCESEMRQIHLSEGKSTEVTLADIYNRLEYYSGIDPQMGQRLELEKEKEVCFANPYMYEVFQILHSAGKRIFAVSDMYLPKKQMQELLKKCGYDHFEDVLVSCDYYCNKSSGGLFKVLKGKIGSNSSIIHIGDNWNADIKGAEKENIDSRYYTSCRNLGNVHRCAGMSVMIKSAYDGILNTTLHNGSQQYSMAWEYGFCYGGLVCLGFTNWIYSQAKQDGIDKLLFAARDGYIIKKIYDSLKLDIPNDYIFWSRLASLSCISKTDRYYFLCRNILELENGTSTIQDCLDLMGLSQLTDLCIKANILPETPLMETNKKILCDFLVQNWESVANILRDKRDAMIAYIRELIGDAKKVAVIDIGWSSQNLIPLFKILQEDLGRTVTIYMIGSRNVAQNPVEQLNGKVKCYMFSSNYNRLVFDRVLKEKNNLIMESLLFAPQCSFETIENLNVFQFVAPEIQNYQLVNEMSDGIFTFCEKYTTLSSHFPALRNISGYDSFMPIRNLLSNKKYVNLAMANLSTNMTLSKHNDEKRVTFSEILH